MNRAIDSLSGNLVSLFAGADEPRQFLSQLAEKLHAHLAGTYLALVRGHRGNWDILSEAGRREGGLPTDILAEALDTDGMATDDAWTAIPLTKSGEVLLLLEVDESTQRDAADVAPLLGDLLLAAKQSDRFRRRIRRLEEILAITAEWRKTDETGDLLEQMAEASTRLLDAERASIFLWDRANKTLVGRPALGVDNELRIPDDSGVVGQVVQTGEIRRVNVGEDQGEIDRRVDQQLKFETKSLLCVPLMGKSNECFGAFEVINKRNGSFSDEDESGLVELATHAALALENTQEFEQLVRARRIIADQAAQGVQLIGASPAIEALRETIDRVADTELAILILGENGTGKEVVSQLLHYLSRRRTEPFVAVNCAALTETLLESELFGHEKGAFTDAHDTRIGKFELAAGGTLFLDEIGDMSLSGQAKLLRVLEDKTVVRVGGSTPIFTDVRVIAATNQNLAEKVRQNKFRQDLYYRLNVLRIDLPPLRERGDDILLLADHFLKGFCAQAGRKVPNFAAEARKRLLHHRWPGNVRELRNLMERLAYLSSGTKVEADELAFIFSPEGDDSQIPGDLPLTEATRRFQVDYIRRHIHRARGNMTDAAQLMGLHRSNLYRKMRQLDMSEEEDEDK